MTQSISKTGRFSACPNSTIHREYCCAHARRFLALSTLVHRVTCAPAPEIQRYGASKPRSIVQYLEPRLRHFDCDRHACFRECCKECCNVYTDEAITQS